ncbi:MAG: FliM/FliN family flagellar motor switch protein [Planctomycetes bacterium]|nr:FliM/FliN family flagellar motor switch protein [Planctomycetota bacterium]MBI3833053.1 FliM/FliN family flagellar motor switch protein [Planctomycetota bacterium]
MSAQAPITSSSAHPRQTRNPELDRILGLTVPCSVILARRQMSIQSILAVTVGTIVEFNVPFDADLTLYVANHPIARGQAIKVGENFGLRIDKIDSIEHRIDALGGR